MKFLNTLSNFIYPKKCGICNKICKNYLCENCERKLQKIEKIKINKVKNKYFSEHLYIFKYDGIIRKKIISYKFNDNAYLYNFFAKIILKNKKAYSFLENYDIIIPISIHKKRLKQRGYNQTELIAQEIVKNIEKLELKNNILIKIKNTNPQSTLNKSNRKNNLMGAYKIINSEEIRYKNIVLIDDVYTTGSTVNECSKILKQAGAGKIGVITIAKD